jgi:hypothetical protein
MVLVVASSAKQRQQQQHHHHQHQQRTGSSTSSVQMFLRPKSGHILTYLQYFIPDEYSGSWQNWIPFKNRTSFGRSVLVSTEFLIGS